MGYPQLTVSLLILSACGATKAVGVDAAVASQDAAAEIAVLSDNGSLTADVIVTAADIAGAPDAPQVAADLPPPVDAGCTAAGCACSKNEQCDSGYCIETATGQQCAKNCADKCDDGFKCAQVTRSDGDILQLCVPSYPRLCEPCLADTDCNNVLGGAESRCAPYKEKSGQAVGNFCGSKCTANSDCAMGFSCKQISSVEGIKGDQCVKDDLVCGCDDRATKLALATACSNANTAGTCAGKRSCSANGLSACDAKIALPEQCNKKDDNCDGQIDEPTQGMCDDGTVCSYDNCIAGECQHPPNAAKCDDANACTENDECSGIKCVGKAVVCDDNNACTSDSCDAKIGCNYTSDDGGKCSDENVCTTSDSCKEGVCLPGAATVCDDGNPCTTDSCDSTNGCIFSNNILPCSDGDVCTTGDTCKGGSCGHLGKMPCDDGNVCADDSCDSLKGCVFSNNGASCSDNNVCTEGDTCKGGSCDPGSTKVCNDLNVCTIDSCDAKKGCQNIVNSAPCSDNSLCTENDSCQNASCVGGAAKNCNDGNPCSDDSCDSLKGCVFTNNAAVCDDNNKCTIGDTCKDGTCTPAAPSACDDKNPCTTETCDPKSGCKSENNTTNCSDDSLCTVNDVCAGGKCSPGKALVCNDGNPCTADACDAVVGCVYAATADQQACGAGPTTWCSAGKCVAKPPAVGAQRDYGMWYWPGNHRPTESWPAVQRAMHVLTGHYGLVWNEETGGLERLGAVTNPIGAADALGLDNQVVAAMPAATLTFEAGAAVGASFLGAAAATIDRAQMVDGGSIAQRIRIPTVGYTVDPALSGSVQLTSLPRHFTFSHKVNGGAAASAVRIRLGGQAVTGFSNEQWLVPGRALRRVDKAGNGWVFLVAKAAGRTLATAPDGAVVAEQTVGVLPPEGNTVELTVIAAQAVNDAELAMFLAPSNGPKVSYQLLDLTGKAVGAPAPATWSNELGAYLVTLGTLQQAGGPAKPDYNNPAFHNWYGRHRIEVTRPGNAKMAVPLALFGNGFQSWNMTGGLPMLRDESGSPTGTAVQLSKNWHGQTWYHLYAQPTFVGPGSDTLELTMASSRWGQFYAASHAQLSLVGYNTAGGHWDESALGAFGESVTYDPDVTLQRSMVDDVRPFLVQDKTKWSWTGNVGGADFLRYRTKAAPFWERRLARVRSRYAAPGPNLTDVTYAGVSSDQAIGATLRTQLVGTDDVVRVYYLLDYEFLQDVEYDRLALFQVAADNYADNLFAHYAYGNDAATLFDGLTPDHKTTGYASDADRGIPLTGSSPWVLLYDNKKDWDTLPENHASVGFVVRAFEAKIGGMTLTTPHINVQRTFNGKLSQMAFELGLPHAPGSPWCGAPCQGKTRFVPKGSRVRATLEYLVLPANKALYYGAAGWLQNLAPAAFGSADQMRLAAAGNALQVQVAAGKLVRAQPTEVAVAKLGGSPVVAELEVTGGLGYVPLTFLGLPHHDAWQLQRLEGGAWNPYAPAVHGNDYWQARYDPESATWSLTYNVPGGPTKHWRLVDVGAP
ncbi:MAG: hypothetical protein EXR77_20025 [Myxococcales bacterium]|nr:hypothetical protein [Myxococcales bacterium]